ncbi:DUF6010 family protein [Micromonospora sp. DR5-3]|uniref:DUF6010 family protein n=1 Tax=unclassified Micromonospora TaxID=2617518 RepID=UPI001CA385C2|nr:MULTISPECIES: DUF6010 family protein [unclassified Micromonospora]MCW3813348.1 DUF6010 family protein [Micromonospora sp. DR5-3]
MTILVPVLIGLLYVCLNAFIREPHRRTVNAIMVGGAGAAYLSGGGLGFGEFPFVVLLTYVAWRGLTSWTWIGIGWLLHTAWDVVHHLKGAPIIPFLPGSSHGCAICDPVIALWAFTGGRSVADLVRRVLPSASSGDATAGSAGVGGATRTR